MKAQPVLREKLVETESPDDLDVEALRVPKVRL